MAIPSRLISKNCEYCGKEFKRYALPVRRFCSKSCSASFTNILRKKVQEPRECPVCHSLFIVTDQRRKHCSNACRHIGHRKVATKIWSYIPKPLTVKICGVCGNPFPAKRAAKFCLDCRETKRLEYARRTWNTEAYKEAHRRLAKEWQRSNPEKCKASSLVKSHPERLNILYECPCEATGKHHHHPDYSKTYDVILLCDRCHVIEHKRLRSLILIPGPMAVNQMN